MNAEKVAMLKELIKSKGKSVRGFSEEMGFAESTFYRKVKAKNGGFTIGEAQRMSEKLALTSEQKQAVFY